MKFDSGALAYLTGDEFSGSKAFKFTQSNEDLDRPMFDRISLLEKILSGQHVVHVGCVDHTIEHMLSKIEKNAWLHQRLSAVTARCLGVDVNSAGIEYMRQSLGYDDALCCDLSAESVRPVTDAKWDYMLLGELVEHIDNPVAFLTALRGRYSDSVASILITVPNAFKYKNFTRSLRNVERINTDHRYWFTPYTIAKVLTHAGFSVEAFYMTTSDPVPAPGIFKFKKRREYRQIKRNALLRDSIVVIAKFVD